MQVPPIKRKHQALFSLTEIPVSVLEITKSTPQYFAVRKTLSWRVLKMDFLENSVIHATFFLPVVVLAWNIKMNTHWHLWQILGNNKRDMMSSMTGEVGSPLQPSVLIDIHALKPGFFPHLVKGWFVCSIQRMKSKRWKIKHIF